MVYAVQWKRFRSIHKKLQCIFMYLDRHYVPNESDGALEVYHFALKMWYKKVFRNCHRSLLDDLLKFVKLDRDGRNIDRDLISCVSSKLIHEEILFKLFIFRLVKASSKSMWCVKNRKGQHTNRSKWFYSPPPEITIARKAESL